MDKSHKLALYVAYYLSRFDLIAYRSLGFENRSKAHHKLGKLLKVKPATLKNMRDEFDPIHGHRAGWYQRPMSPTRVRIVEALEELSQEEIFEIVTIIIGGISYQENEELDILANIIPTNDEKDSKRAFSTRGITGKKAEDYFKENFKRFTEKYQGKLIDTREHGTGYDFVIEGDEKFYIEVKGLAKEKGGLSFTSKEWQKAKEHKQNFILALVTNIDNNPSIKFIENPSEYLNPQKQLIATVQVRWNVSNVDI